MDVNKVSSIEIISKAVKLYKNNVRKFIGVSAVTSLITLFMMAFLDFNAEFYLGSSLWWLIVLIKLGFAIVAIWAIIRLNVAFFFIISQAWKGKDLGLKQAFEMAKGYTASLFLTEFGLAILLGIPSGLITWHYSSKDLTTGIFFFIIGGVIYTILGVKFGLAPVSCVLTPNELGAFEHSNRLVKGNFISSTVVIGLSGLLRPSISLLNKYLVVTTPMHKMGFEAGKLLLSCLYMPFKYALLISLFYGLHKIKEEPKKRLEIKAQ